jgi:hypothetical protein
MTQLDQHVLVASEVGLPYGDDPALAGVVGGAEPVERRTGRRHLVGTSALPVVEPRRQLLALPLDLVPSLTGGPLPLLVLEAVRDGPGSLLGRPCRRR